MFFPSFLMESKEKDALLTKIPMVDIGVRLEPTKMAIMLAVETFGAGVAKVVLRNRKWMTQQLILPRRRQQLQQLLLQQQQQQQL